MIALPLIALSRFLHVPIDIEDLVPLPSKQNLRLILLHELIIFSLQFLIVHFILVIEGLVLSPFLVVRDAPLS